MFDDEFEDDLSKEGVPNSNRQSGEASYLAPDLDSYPKKSRQEAVAKYELILFIREQITKGWTQKNLNPLISEYFTTHRSLERPNWRTVVRWHKKLLDHGDTPVSLIDKHHKKGNRNRKLLLDHEHFFEAATNRYLQAERPSVASAYRFYKDQCLLQGHNINPMSLRAFYDRVDKLNSYEVDVKRFGKYKADVMYGYKGSTVKPERIMQRVEIDHTVLDVVLIDDETDMPIGRPSLTLLKCALSGCIVGYNLTFKAPSYASVAKAISHTMLEKNKSKEIWGIDWPCYGKIEVLVVDNGAEFWSKSLEQMCFELGINIQYNPVRKPWLKPFIERSFKTINDMLLNELSGKTFGNAYERGDYDPVKSADVPFSVFVYVFEKWAAEVYNCSPNSQGMKVPSIIWQDGVEKFPPANLSDSEIKELPKLTGLKESRTIQPSGITYIYLRYDSEELADYRKKYWSNAKDSLVTIKVDVDDLSQIFVYLPELEKYLTVPCVDQEYTKNLSLDQHLITRTYIKKRNKLLGKTELELAKARDEIRDAVEQHDIKATTSKKLTTSKKAAQFKGYNNESVKSKKTKQQTNDVESANVDNDISYLESLWQSFDK